MKKIFAIVITFAMILSMGAMLVNAELPEGIDFNAGKYGVENAADFTTVGDLKITWDPEASSKLDLTDGDMEDWAKAGYNMVTIDTANMVSWVGDHTTAPVGWSISTYFVADSDWLYIGFYVTDDYFVYSAPNTRNGDCFQVCIDFGGKLGQMLETDPENLLTPKNIFYSFGCVEDGAPIAIEINESDGNDGWITEADEFGVKGAAKKTDTGWAAEFALSWNQLYDDYSNKAWEDPKIYVGSDQRLPLEIGCCLYYLDVDESNQIVWAAGTTNGIADDAGVPQVSWTAYDNGINLDLDYVDGMTFGCENIVVLPLTETTPEETEAPTEPETDAPETDPETAAPETNAPETDAPATDAPATEAPTTETEGGCGSVIGFSAIAILAAAAAAIALKKD